MAAALLVVALAALGAAYLSRPRCEDVEERLAGLTDQLSTRAAAGEFALEVAGELRDVHGELGRCR
jgi:hypothetical protein